MPTLIFSTKNCQRGLPWQHHILKQKIMRTPDETIDLICYFAKEKDKQALINLIDSGVSINIQKWNGNGRPTHCV